MEWSAFWRWSAPSCSPSTRSRSTFVATAASSPARRSAAGVEARGRSPLTPSAMHIEVVTIGDELLLGYTIDTNAAHLARTLAAEGVEISRRTTVGDTADAIAAAVREGLDRAGAVITTGGLGPTSDDLTKPSIAALFGRGMVLDAEHLAWMEDRFVRLFQRPMPAANRQ